MCIRPINPINPRPFPGISSSTFMGKKERRLQKQKLDSINYINATLAPIKSIKEASQKATKQLTREPYVANKLKTWSGQLKPLIESFLDLNSIASSTLWKYFSRALQTDNRSVELSKETPSFCIVKDLVVKWFILRYPQNFFISTDKSVGVVDSNIVHKH
uniref:Uncharacterized protein n=1 Tax=Glossina austeni TaxID=7395 RepID=A0A1A9V7E3_GLOAU